MKRPISEPTWTHTRTNALSPRSLNYPVACTVRRRKHTVLCLRSKTQTRQLDVNAKWDCLQIGDSSIHPNFMNYKIRVYYILRQNQIRRIDTDWISSRISANTWQMSMFSLHSVWFLFDLSSAWEKNRQAIFNTCVYIRLLYPIGFSAGSHLVPIAALNRLPMDARVL